MRDKESKTPGQVGRFCYLVESSRKKANSLSPLNECPIVHFTSVFFLSLSPSLHPQSTGFFFFFRCSTISWGQLQRNKSCGRRCFLCAVNRAFIFPGKILPSGRSKRGLQGTNTKADGAILLYTLLCAVNIYLIMIRLSKKNCLFRH